MFTADGRNKAIATPRQRLDESWAVPGISQRLAQLIDRRVQTVVEVDESIGRPVLGTKLFAGYYLAGPLQQGRENVKRLFLELDPHTLLAQLYRPQVYFKGSEAQECG